MNVKTKADIHALVVDDREDIRETTREYLNQIGVMSVISSENAIEALQLLEKHSEINLILSDWEMPGMTGLSFLEKIRASPHFRHLPFIMMTSEEYIVDEKVILARDSLVDGYLVKPFRITLLDKTITSMLSRSIHGPQKYVVLVDDDTDSLLMTTEFLVSYGFKKIKTFPDGEAALEFIQDSLGNIEIIISDWEMPKMKGVELLAYCKRTPELNGVPFFMITSQVSRENLKIEMAAQRQVDNYLLKPFSRDELKKRIDEAFDLRRKDRIALDSTDKGFESLNRGHYKAASLAFQKALSVNPDFDMGLSGVGDLKMKSESAETAIPYYQKAMTVNPSNPYHYLRLATAYVMTDKEGKAINILNAGLKIIPDNAEIRYTLAELYFNKQMFSAASQELTTLFERHPKFQDTKNLVYQIKIITSKK